MANTLTADEVRAIVGDLLTDEDRVCDDYWGGVYIDVGSARLRQNENWRFDEYGIDRLRANADSVDVLRKVAAELQRVADMMERLVNRWND